MITEDYVSFDIAKLLKEKGFDWDTYAYYEDENNPNISLRASKAINWNKTEFISKPTLQIAMKWLREVHKVLIVIDAYHADHWEGYIDSFEISIYSHASTMIVPNEIAHHTDYEDAVEAALKYVLGNLIKE